MGYEVCQELKADPSTSDIPVIFISALDDVLDKVKAFRMGGVDYVTKPFQPQEVLARIESQLKIWALQRELEKQNAELQKRNDDLTAAYRARSPNTSKPSKSWRWKMCSLRRSFDPIRLRVTSFRGVCCHEESL